MKILQRCIPVIFVILTGCASNELLMKVDPTLEANAIVYEVQSPNGWFAKMPEAAFGAYRITDINRGWITTTSFSRPEFYWINIILGMDHPHTIRTETSRTSNYKFRIGDEAVWDSKCLLLTDQLETTETTSTFTITTTGGSDEPGGKGKKGKKAKKAKKVKKVKKAKKSKKAKKEKKAKKDKMAKAVVPIAPVKPENKAKPGKPEHAATPDKPDHAATPGKPDHAAKPNKTGKPGKPDKNGKQIKITRTKTTETDVELLSAVYACKYTREGHDPWFFSVKKYGSSNLYITLTDNDTHFSAHATRGYHLTSDGEESQFLAPSDTGYTWTLDDNDVAAVSMRVRNREVWLDKRNPDPMNDILSMGTAGLLLFERRIAPRVRGSSTPLISINK